MARLCPSAAPSTSYVDEDESLLDLFPLTFLFSLPSAADAIFITFTIHSMMSISVVLPFSALLPFAFSLLWPDAALAKRSY